MVKSNDPSFSTAVSHYLPRLRPEFYQADAVVFWTLTIANRKTGWLNDRFHAVFREIMLHSAAREGLFCPAYCLMPDHIHFVWMGMRKASDQLNGTKFLRKYLNQQLDPAAFGHQGYDHVLTEEERKKSRFSVTCSDYVLLNAYRAGLVKSPPQWPFLGAIVSGYPDINPFDSDYWPWFWKRYLTTREPGIQQRCLPRNRMR